MGRSAYYDAFHELLEHKNPCGGASLRNLRRALGYDQFHFADMLGMNQVSLSKIEREDGQLKKQPAHYLVFAILVATWRLGPGEMQNLGAMAIEAQKSYGYAPALAVLISAGQWAPGKGLMPWPPQPSSTCTPRRSRPRRARGK